MLSSSCRVSCARLTSEVTAKPMISRKAFALLAAIKQIFCAVRHFDFLTLLTRIRSSPRRFPALGIDPLNIGGRYDRPRPGAGTGFQQQPGNGPRIRRIRLLQFGPFDAGTVLGLPYRVMFGIKIMAHGLLAVFGSGI